MDDNMIKYSDYLNKELSDVVRYIEMANADQIKTDEVNTIFEYIDNREYKLAYDDIVDIICEDKLNISPDICKIIIDIAEIYDERNRVADKLSSIVMGSRGKLPK